MVIGVLVIGLLLLVAGVMYLLLMGVFTVGWFRNKKSSVVSRQSSVSVVIAVRNEEEFIEDLLKDLLLQDYQEDLIEVIVVDDHSADGTVNIVYDFIVRKGTVRIVLLKNEEYQGSGKKDALSLGVAHATGEIVLCTDADCRVRSGWISAMVSYFLDEKIKMVFGPVKYFEGKTLSDHFQALEFAGLMASAAGSAGARRAFMCSGANLAYRKDAFSRVKGFEGNEKYLSGDDVFLLHKMKKKFGRNSIVFCKDVQAMVHTYPAPGFRKFLDQRVRWASKSRGYRNPLAVATALIVFIYNFILSATFIAGIIYPLLFLFFAGFLLLKSIADLPLMLGITGFTGDRKLMKWYLPFQVVYPFYVVAAGVLSLFPIKRW